uniref:Endoplasmic reticulum vesicle protein 25 n=1 Tax=Phakopsora pachyrhizi TaxID=170000 RepID=A0A0S1MIE8_PHAPC
MFTWHDLHRSKGVDLDIDIVANAVEYKAIAKKGSLSELKVNMMKLEGIFFFNFSGTQLLKMREAKIWYLQNPS